MLTNLIICITFFFFFLSSNLSNFRHRSSAESIQTHHHHSLWLFLFVIQSSGFQCALRWDWKQGGRKAVWDGGEEPRSSITKPVSSKVHLGRVTGQPHTVVATGPLSTRVAPRQIHRWCTYFRHIIHWSLINMRGCWHTNLRYKTLKIHNQVNLHCLLISKGFTRAIRSRGWLFIRLLADRVQLIACSIQK